MSSLSPSSQWVILRMAVSIHVNPWLIHVNVWQKPLQYCKIISFQLIKINEKINKLDKQKKTMAVSILVNALN